MPLAEFCLIFLCHFHVMKAFTDEMKRLCVTDATSLLTLVQKMLRCGSEETFKTTLETIRNQFPTFHAYLDDNWLPHRALFAGYKRRGVLHLDNHTNNRLERYHHTIKTVVRYTGRLSAAHYQRTVSGHAAQRFQQETEDFVKQFRHQTVRSISVSICRFSHCLCLRGCCKAHRNTSEDDSFTFGSNSATNTSCTCTAHTRFGLPCKHIFYVRKQLGMPAFEIALCHTRCLSHDSPVIEATPSMPTSSTVHTQISSVTPRHKTRAERFKTAMMIFTSMASTLSDLPPQRFAKSAVAPQYREHCARWNVGEHHRRC